MKEEIFKPIEGYEGLYEISNYGRCKGLPLLTNFGNHTKLFPERILRPKRRNGRYSSYVLCKEGVHTTCMIHRLVAIHFMPNPKNLREVNHLDGNKENNYEDNLEWCTASDNCLHALDTGLNTIRKLTKDNVIEIRESSLPNKQLAIIYKVCPQNIHAVRQLKTWKHVV